MVFLGLFGRWLLRQLSKDRASAAADRSEVTQIKRLEDEIKRQTDRADREGARADLAYRERNEAIEKGAVAVGEVHALRIEVGRLTDRIKSLEEIVRGFYMAGSGGPIK